jgi:spore germination protein GerM
MTYRQRGGSGGRWTRSRIVVSTSLLVLLGACATQETPDATPTPQPTTSTQPNSSTQPTTSEPNGIVVYFMLEQLDDDPPGPFLVPVHREAVVRDDPAMTVMQVLLDGPTSDETAGTPAISTAIPESTEILGIELLDGLATVDLSGKYDDGGGSSGMFARLAQVVYTLTRISGIAEVQFEIEGEVVTEFSSEGIELDGPQQRNDYYDLLPPIFVDHPAWGEPVTSPIRVQGLSNVFEATSQVMLTDDDGEPLFEGTVTATCGTGCWGEWSTEIAYEVDRDQFGALIVWEFSAKDGSRIHIQEYPIRLE